MRSYQVGSEYTTDQVAKRLLLYLGKRTSAVCARIYDKGLETGSAPAGVWERFEVEFKEDRASTVMMELLNIGDGWPKELWQRVVGAVDFRVNNGRSELRRRERAGWWEELIGDDVPKPTKPMAKESSLAVWEGWTQQCVLRRVLQIANAKSVDVMEYLEALLDGLRPARSITPAVVEAMSIGKNARTTYVARDQSRSPIVP